MEEVVGCGQATTSYPSDVSDEEWAVALPYVTLLAPTALQRKQDLCGLQCCTLSGANRRALALFAQRFSAMAGGLPAMASLAGGGQL
jgi:hypothetical protein